MNVEQARKVLEENGYAVNCLWMDDDVHLKYKCSKEEALIIVEEALESEGVMEYIWDTIDEIAYYNELKIRE